MFSSPTDSEKYSNALSKKQKDTNAPIITKDPWTVESRGDLSSHTKTRTHIQSVLSSPYASWTQTGGARRQNPQNHERQRSGRVAGWVEEAIESVE